jgi:hypothetical protein
MEQSDWFSHERILQSVPGYRTCFFLVEIFFSHYNKHLIDRACSFPIGGYWAHTFLHVFLPVAVHTMGGFRRGGGVHPPNHNKVPFFLQNLVYNINLV